MILRLLTAHVYNFLPITKLLSPIVPQWYMWVLISLSLLISVLLTIHG